MAGPTPQPATFSGSFVLASDPTLPASPIPFNYSGTFVSLVADVINVTAPGTVNVPFGSVVAPGAKGVLVRYDAAQPANAAAVQMTLNGGSQPIELTPGSFFVYFNATPAAGVTALSFAVTAACQLRVWLLG